MSWRGFVICVALIGLVVLSIGFGCGTSKPPALTGDFDQPGILTGPCSPDGATHVCSTDLGAKHGVHDCFAGTQVCQNGLWGPCTGTRTLSATISQGDLRTAYSSTSSTLRPMATPMADASGCANDPCDPACLGFDQDAGNTCTTTTTYAGSITGSGIPNAQMVALQMDKNNWAPGSYKSDCSHWSTGGASTANYYNACGLDSSCNTSTNFCNAWLAGQSFPASKCAGADVTVGVACSNAGEFTIPVCNRGSAAISSGTTITVTEWSNPG